MTDGKPLLPADSQARATGFKPPPESSLPEGEYGKVIRLGEQMCHGPDGQGQRSGDQQVFPPLWGPRWFTGSVAETRKKFHDTEDSLYGLKVLGGD